MTCEAEKQVLAKVRRHRLRAAYHVQYETSLAELDVLRSNARIYDWGAVRFAETLMRCWDSRCSQAENALERCRKRTKNKKMSARHN